jgi:diguanylate cyclase (GGDEF)-like protein/PAS domain S-box-containing protein
VRHLESLATETLGASTHATEAERDDDAPAWSEALFRRLVEDQTELVSLATPTCVLTFVNRAYARWYGLPPHEIVGKSLLEFVPPKDRTAVLERLRRVCEFGREAESENQVIMSDGRARWFAWTNRGVTNAEGRVVAIHSVGRDVEARVVAEQRLKESEARYRLLAEQSRDMVIELDLDFVRRYVSPACRELFGYEPEDLIGDKSGSMSHPDDAEDLRQILQSLRDGRVDRHEFVCRRRHRDGRWIWVDTRYRTLKDPRTGAPAGIIATVRDVSARKLIEDQLAEVSRRLEALAQQDGLTGLANRRSFDDALSRRCEHAKRRDESLGLIMIDVDWFKAFNDRYGHPAGDECLRRVGGAITAATRRPGDLAARYGGEEFVVLMPDADEAETAMIGERIRQAVLQLKIEHETSAHQVVTVSLGVASIGQNAFEDGPETILLRADRALYSAKNGGRNAVVRASLLSQPSGRVGEPAVSNL